MPKTKPLPVFENLGALITFKDGEKDRYLGYLMNFEGRGVYDAHFGLVSISPAHAEEHNKQLDLALIKGCHNCEIGEAGTFYLKETLPFAVTTFLGAAVSTDVVVVPGGRGKRARYIFKLGAKQFQGHIVKDSEMFHFERIS